MHPLQNMYCLNITLNAQMHFVNYWHPSCSIEIPGLADNYKAILLTLQVLCMASRERPGPSNKHPGMTLIACSFATVYNACHSESPDAVRSCANTKDSRAASADKHSTERVLPCLTVHSQTRLPFGKPIVKKTTCLNIPLQEPANAFQNLLGPTIQCTSAVCRR